MNYYEIRALEELRRWQAKIDQGPSLVGQLAQSVQEKINTFIPEKVHQVITQAIRHMVRAVLFGSEFTAGRLLRGLSLEEREREVKKRVEAYKKMAAFEGAWTGAGGFLLSLADFPMLLSLKMKLLFDIAGLYGYNVSNYQERVFILYIFQLAFSGAERRLQVYYDILTWEEKRKTLPEDMSSFDWQTFQQEYRDYLDLAKILQMVPGVGAVIGAYANHRLVDRLGETAINVYRMRWLETGQLRAEG